MRDGREIEKYHYYLKMISQFEVFLELLIKFSFA
jgi:hypothetical protein